MNTQNKRLTGILLTVAALLLVPFMAMQFSNEIRWSGVDFMVVGVLLLSIGLLCEFVLRKVKTARNRIVIIAVLLVLLFLIWAELAVGIFGSPFAGS